MTPIAVSLLKRAVIDDNGCWVWTGYISGWGYGRYRFGGKTGATHRLAYEVFTNRPIPDGLVIDHLCRNRACMNPAHLEPVTNAENVRRGDLATGIRNGQGRKTHCKMGHSFDATNTLYRSNGFHRTCRACANESARRARLKARDAARRSAGSLAPEDVSPERESRADTVASTRLALPQRRVK